MRWPPPHDWPLAAISRKIYCRPHRWHVQETGTGPTVICLHGAGGSTHSFRALIPLLARDHHVIALDLPGQGFTQLGARHRCGLEPTAADIAALCARQGWRPALVIGHSAGAAVALRLAGLFDPVPRVVGINPALARFDGLAGALFPALARLLAVTPFTAALFSRTTATPARIRSLIDSTGSDIGPEGQALYRRLVADAGHVDGTLLMMAQWNLDSLLADLPDLEVSALFLVGERDATVAPAVAMAAAARMRDARVETLPKLGHLAHEEAPDICADRIRAFMAGTLAKP
ncbi:MAG: alpha/beta fold hydrolase [Rhodobacteraceae bacterium]|nr:alpha/beta fold hydrolase [Paracoccaceae bacterium]